VCQSAILCGLVTRVAGRYVSDAGHERPHSGCHIAPNGGCIAFDCLLVAQSSGGQDVSQTCMPRSVVGYIDGVTLGRQRLALRGKDIVERYQQ
jgi:hypothetical protein